MSTKRIKWVDTAKGLAILLVIAGHTAEMGSFTRSIIFSFHIPLFFILSGYTFHPAETKKEFQAGLLHDAVRLLIPYALTAVIITLVQILYRHNPVMEELRLLPQALLWASGTGDGKHPAIGILWFLASMFTVRQLFSLCVLFFGKKDWAYLPVAGVIAVIGIGLGFMDWNWLIFNLDVSMAAVGFFAAGYLFRQYEERIESCRPAVFSVCVIIWTYLLKAFGYIEMSGRWYPEFSLGILEALCGSYCVIAFCKSLEKTGKLSEALNQIGRASLMIMCVHAVEDRVFSFWLKGNIAMHTLERIVLDVSVGLFLTWLIYGRRKKQVES